MRVLVDTLLNLIMILVFGAVMFFVATREANAMEPHVTFVMHCPGCDSPDQGNSDFQRRYEAGKNQPGDGRGTPYEPRESNIERYNREYQKEQERERERQERQQQQQQRPYGEPHSKRESPPIVFTLPGEDRPQVQAQEPPMQPYREYGPEDFETSEERRARFAMERKTLDRQILQAQRDQERERLTKQHKEKVDAHLRVILAGYDKRDYREINKGLRGLLEVDPERMMSVWSDLVKWGMDARKLAFSHGK